MTGRGASTSTDITMSSEGEVRFADSVGGQYAAIKSPNDLSANYTLTLPANDGNASEVLQTDGSGNLSWVAATGGSSSPTISSKSANFTVATTEDNYLYLITGVTTATLPSLASVSDGFRVTFNRVGAGNVVIDGSGSQTINGATTRTLASNYSTVSLVKTSTEWVIVAGGATGASGGCSSGMQTYPAGSTYTLNVSASQATNCTYTVTVKGAGGGDGRPLVERPQIRDLRPQ